MTDRQTTFSLLARSLSKGRQEENGEAPGRVPSVEQFGAKSNESDAEEADNLFEFNLTKMDENDEE